MTKRRKGPDREELLRNAVERVKQNVTTLGNPYYDKVVAEFKVPKSTLFDRHTKGNIVRGHIFTANQEKTLIQVVKKQQQGEPFTKVSFLAMIHQYIKVKILYLIFFFLYKLIVY